MLPVPGVTKRMEIDLLTPVFSTALRPKGLSGVIRRMAYRIPESHARHWATLMLADRVDVLEHRVAKLVKVMVLVPAGTAAAVLIVAKVAGPFRQPPCAASTAWTCARPGRAACAPSTVG